MNKNGFYYLAVPYQGSEEEKLFRAELSLKVTTAFLHQGIHLFAPILYVNKIAESLGFSSLDQRRQVIMPYLFDFLKASKAMLLVTTEGWQDSWGIQQELQFCYEQDIPVYKMQPDEINGSLGHILSNPLNNSQVYELIQNK